MMFKNNNFFGLQPAKLLIQNQFLITDKVTALDIGCANGANSYYLATLGLTVDAVDILLPELKPEQNINFIQSDIMDFKFVQNYDVILAFNVFQFLSINNRNLLIKKMNNILSLYGIMFIRSFLEGDSTQFFDNDINNYLKKGELFSIIQSYHLEIKLYKEEFINDNHFPIGEHNHNIVS
ncbi:MAG: class I SAM-dependent methyltransferase, partial [Deltaproteobacteria bacterium]|nr:class I SAM-dependent methyltransferase [Deltaproteobacteria bacterium]